MRLDAQSGVRGLLLNVETGQPIRWVRWAEIPSDPRQQGEYEAWRYPPDECRSRYAAGQDRASLLVQGRCRLQFIPAAPVYGIRPTAPRDLAGSLDEARGRVDQRLLILSEECSEPKCHRFATWGVSWEQIIEPERDAEGVLHERAVCVRRLAFCDRHYRPPIVVSERGVESEVEVEVRPS